LAGDAALLVRSVELGDRSRAALAGEDVGPARLDVATQRGDEAQSGYDHSAHRTLQNSVSAGKATGPTPFRAEPVEAHQGRARRPSTTSGRTAERRASALVLFDVLVGVADRVDLLGRVVGNLDAELFLEGHHQLDDVEAVGAEIVDEARVGGDLVFLDAQVLDYDLLHAVGGVAHVMPSRNGVGFAVALMNGAGAGKCHADRSRPPVSLRAGFPAGRSRATAARSSPLRAAHSWCPRPRRGPAGRSRAPRASAPGFPRTGPGCTGPRDRPRCAARARPTRRRPP